MLVYWISSEGESQITLFHGCAHYSSGEKEEGTNNTIRTPSVSPPLPPSQFTLLALRVSLSARTITPRWKTAKRACLVDLPEMERFTPILPSFFGCFFYVCQLQQQGQGGCQPGALLWAKLLWTRPPAAIKDVDRQTELFRPPYGDINDRVLSCLGTTTLDLFFHWSFLHWNTCVAWLWMVIHYHYSVMSAIVTSE